MVVASFEIRAGRMVLSDIHYLLDRVKLFYSDINYVESGGILYHLFTIKGDLASIEQFADHFFQMDVVRTRGKVVYTDANMQGFP